MMYYQTIQYIHVLYCIVLPNRKILLDNINEFHFQTKTLTLLIVCKENPELYLYQIIQ